MTEQGDDSSIQRGPFGTVRLARSLSMAPAAREQAAFEALLEQCWDSLWRYAFHCTGNRDDAGDLLSEAIIEGFRGFSRFRGDTTFLRWMYRITTTTRIDMLRRNKRHLAESLDTFDEDGELCTKEIPDDSLNPEHLVLAPMLSEPVQLALNGLSEEYRTVIALADIEQLDYAEVSHILQIPIGTVRSRLHRARLQLRKTLAPYVEYQW